MAESGPYLGSAVNADSGAPLIVNDERVLATEFEKIRRSEILGGPDGGSGKDRRSIYSPLWQADGKRIRRFAPLEFVGRYMKDFFDYGIADEVHELSNDTAQGNALGTLARAVDKIAVLTGTLMGGYADDLFNVLYRLEPHKMVAEGYEWGEPGVRSFAETYGVLERVTIIAPEENACSKAKVTKQVKRKPGASPLLFGKFLMELGAFVSLEDISSELPSYREEVIGVDMDEPLAKAYTDLEEQIKEALEEHRGNHSVISTALNALLSYPDRPYGLGDLIGTEYDPESHRRVPFLIAKTQDLPEDLHYAKERKLIECIKADLARGRKCQIYAVYTAKRDVTSRLERVLSQEGIRVSVLTSQVPPDQREAWYERRLREGMQVCVAHPRLVSVGMDLLWAPSIYFVQTGYSIYTLRQASRRSWRIGQRSNVVVRFLTYNVPANSSACRDGRDSTGLPVRWANSIRSAAPGVTVAHSFTPTAPTVANWSAANESGGEAGCPGRTSCSETLPWKTCTWQPCGRTSRPISAAAPLIRAVGARITKAGEPDQDGRVAKRLGDRGPAAAARASWFLSSLGSTFAVSLPASRRPPFSDSTS